MILYEHLDSQLVGNRVDCLFFVQESSAKRKWYIKKSEIGGKPTSGKDEIVVNIQIFILPLNIESFDCK
jgi:hypothetical protein